MPRISLSHAHALPLADARRAIDQVAARMREKFAIEGEWQGDTLRFARPGVSGTIAVGADQVQVDAELGLLLSPLKSVVETEIRRKLAECLA